MKGEATVYPKQGESFDPILIPKAIHNAGFAATMVTEVVDGTLRAKNGSLELDVLGLKHPFVLVGGAQVSALKQAKLVGKKIQVTGKVIAGHGGSPPGLTVESFRPLP